MIYGVEDASDFGIENANAGFVSGGVVSGFGGVGEGRRGYAIARVVSGTRFGKAAMGDGISDIEEEGFVVRSVDICNGCVGGRLLIFRGVEYFVITDFRGIGCWGTTDVLKSRERGCVTRFFECVNEVMAVIVEPKTAVGKSQHTTTVGPLSGQECGSARRAGRVGTKCLTKENALFGEALKIRGGHGMPKGLNVATRVVRVDVEDVWVRH